MIKAFAAGAAVLALGALTTVAWADALRSTPVAVPAPHTVPDAADVPYPGGPIALEIDASDTKRGVYRVKETIPVAPGTRRLTLLYPEWLPGNHAPRGAVSEIVDLRFQSGGKTIAWDRDSVEVFAFHLDLPEGTREVVARFTHTSPLLSSEGRVTMTQEMLNLQWEKMSLYPAGYYVRDIRVRPTVRMPEGWAVGTALDGGTVQDLQVTWPDTDYETLVDSPIFAGKYARTWDLGHGVKLFTIADRDDDLKASVPEIYAYRSLVDEALAVFGSRHFDHYTFLLALTDRMGSIGLEHHRSSENQLTPTAFTNWPADEWDRSLLPHEFSHSWNGKFRRPQGLWTPDYRQPMQDNLLWVYEGQTQFWGLVLAARSGLQSKAMVLGQLASAAGLYTEEPGREWRSIEDTTHDPIFAARKPKPFASLARGEDYYNEGALVWLEADQLIRAGTDGHKSLDDFAAAFFGVRDGDWGVVTYTLDDVVEAMNAIYRYDWATFFRTRVQLPDQPPPLGGIERGGYRLVWKDEPNPYDKARMADAGNLSLYHSIGLIIDKEGVVGTSRWDGPAAQAGIVNGARLVGVNGLKYDPARLKQAITDAKTGGKPISLVVERASHVDTVAVDYRGGLRWPWLERAGSGAGGLDRLLAPRRAVTP